MLTKVPCNLFGRGQAQARGLGWRIPACRPKSFFNSVSWDILLMFHNLRSLKMYFWQDWVNARSARDNFLESQIFRRCKQANLRRGEKAEGSSWWQGEIKCDNRSRLGHGDPFKYKLLQCHSVPYNLSTAHYLYAGTHASFKSDSGKGLLEGQTLFLVNLPPGYVTDRELVPFFKHSS